MGTYGPSRVSARYMHSGSVPDVQGDRRDNESLSMLFRGHSAAVKRPMHSKDMNRIPEVLRTGWQILADGQNSSTVDKTLREIVEVYTQMITGDQGLRKVPNSSQSTSRRSASATFSNACTSATSLAGRKRPMHLNDGDCSDEEESRSPGRKLPRLDAPAPTHESRLLACPYCKNDPFRYSFRNTRERSYRGCSSSYLTTIARLKQHLYRVHKRPDYYCSRCSEIFRSQTQLDDHCRRELPCECGEDKFTEKMSTDQLAAIKRRQPGQGQAEAWFNIYRILFPGAPLPSSPYVDDPVPFEEDVNTPINVEIQQAPVYPNEISSLQGLGLGEVQPTLVPDDGIFQNSPWDFDFQSSTTPSQLGQVEQGFGYVEALEEMRQFPSNLSRTQAVSRSDSSSSSFDSTSFGSRRMASSSGTGYRSSGLGPNYGQSSRHDYDAFDVYSALEYELGVHDITAEETYCDEIQMRYSPTPRLDDVEDLFLDPVIETHPLMPEHRYISKSPVSNLRLIDISPASDNGGLNLVDIFHWETPDYLTVSLDDSDTILPTTTENLERRKRVIYWSELPKIVGDVVLLARNLSIRFVWIESLCVVQDDIAEYSFQHTNLDHIFGDAVANIDSSGTLRSAHNAKVFALMPSNIASSLDAKERQYRFQAKENQSVFPSLPQSLKQSLYETKSTWLSLDIDLRISKGFPGPWNSNASSSTWYPSSESWRFSARKQPHQIYNIYPAAEVEGPSQNPEASPRPIDSDNARVQSLLNTLSFYVKSSRNGPRDFTFELLHLSPFWPGTIVRVTNIILFLEIYSLTRNLSFDKQVEFFEKSFKERLLEYVATQHGTSEVSRGKRKQPDDRDVDEPAQRNKISRNKDHSQTDDVKSNDRESPEVAIARSLSNPANLAKLYRCIRLAAGVQSALESRSCRNCGIPSVQRLKDSHMVDARVGHCLPDRVRFLPNDSDVPDPDQDDNWYRLLLKDNPDWAPTHPNEPLPCPYKGTEERELRYVARYNLDRLWATEDEWQAELTRKRRRAEKAAQTCAKKVAELGNPVEDAHMLDFLDPAILGSPPAVIPMGREDAITQQLYRYPLIDSEAAIDDPEEQLSDSYLAKQLQEFESDRVFATNGSDDEEQMVGSQTGNSLTGFTTATTTSSFSRPGTDPASNNTRTDPTSFSSDTVSQERLDGKLCACSIHDPEHLANRCQMQDRCCCRGCEGWNFNSPTGQLIYMEKMRIFR